MSNPITLELYLKSEINKRAIEINFYVFKNITGKKVALRSKFKQNFDK